MIKLDSRTSASSYCYCGASLNVSETKLMQNE